MSNNGMTINDATHRWVGEFNAISTEMFRVLLNDGYFKEITEPTVGDRVHFDTMDAFWRGEKNLTDALLCGEGEIVGKTEDGKFIVLPDDMEEDEKIEIEGKDLKIIDLDDVTPMWGTMWSFGDPCDADYWMNDEDGIEKLSECGFRVYYSEEFDEYYFGIDGAGYDFYEEHWIPLYKARGLQWHDPETVNND